MNRPAIDSSRILLIGPYDPHCGEYTFLAPPLGVWRLAGVLMKSGAQVLAEFNKAQIHRHIEPMLSAALETGVTPFLDLILSSPASTLDDVATTLREAYRWVQRGCEIGMYPYVIPFSGAAFAQDPALTPHTKVADEEEVRAELFARLPATHGTAALPAAAMA